MEAPLHQYSLVPLPPLHERDPIQHMEPAMAAAARAMVAAVQKPPPAAAMMGRREEQCPRCASRDTKFCYYNNYNTSQPRHFCRACRRYWTLGGSLRNVPVGGSTRKRPRPTRRAFTTTTALGCRRFATSSSSCSPVAPLLAPLGQGQPQVMGHGLLGSLMLGLGAAPLLEGRLGCSDLGGLGQQQPALLAAGLDHQQLGFGVEHLLWPAAATTTVLEGDRALPLQVTPDAALWQELAAPQVEAGGLHHGGSPHLLL